MDNNPPGPYRHRRQAGDPQSAQSALSGYLRSNAINARAITRGHQDRIQAARDAFATAQITANSSTQNVEKDEDEDEDDEDREEEGSASPSATTTISTTEARKRRRKELRKRKELRDMHKIKMTKQFKKRVASRLPLYTDEDVLARQMLREQEKERRAIADFMPGQTENCEICQQRFTVTPYTRAGPNGGLLCTKCGKKLADEEDGKKKGKKATQGPAGRRKDHRKKQAGGSFGIGTKSLVTLCIETLAANISLADSFGDLPFMVIDRIARMLSKRRMMNAHTLELFLQHQPEDVRIYDASQLEQQDYLRIFQVCPKLKHLKLYNAIQFRDEVMEYLIGRDFTLESLYLAGANLLTEKGWWDYLKVKGGHLKSLRVYFTDQHFNQGVLQALQLFCLSLVRLKIYHNQQILDSQLEHIAKIPSLRHVSLHLIKPTTTCTYVYIIQHLGKNLETFSIRMVPQVGDELLEEIHEKCAKLTKLRITHSEVMTDAGFTKLFTGWKNKPLKVIDFEKCLPMTDETPQENADTVGLHASGFEAMMNHSGSKLKKLNLHGCRHISGDAFEAVFASGKKYPELLDLEVSFCEAVTDLIVGLIFKSCPRLEKLNVFGCMRVSDVRVPRGKILIGLSNAKGMGIQGTED
ncbi:RNI-like protein [Annulohypoxylon truncatum]|uniref:RNI-like protein n=1 Tax=Annulohypoxylon truncatum TaxID=327061 RepID=UPI0020072DF6|nr:RNI-like protein [Annulohypoxylon truncatum]KAI1214651.1 RNI-like protein [Annulohypoxylon truncatum]